MVDEQQYVPKERDNASVYCKKCETNRSASARGMYQATHGDDLPIRYYLCECVECHEPFVVFRLPTDTTGMVWEWSMPVQTLPSIDESLPSGVPDKIAAKYREATRNMTVDSYDSAAVMCRRVLDMVCRHFQCSGRGLQKQLVDLKTKGLIDERIHIWADGVLREIGNEATHGDDDISKEDAKDALDFCRAVLDHLFLFMPAHKAFEKRHPPKPTGTP
jgi:hypothetical protein